MNRNVRERTFLLVQQRLKSACASPQSGQSFCCLHEEILHPWLSKIRPAKAKADLNLRWTHMSEGTFWDVSAHCDSFPTGICRC